MCFSYIEINGVMVGSASHAHTQKLSFIKFRLAISDSICEGTSGVCMASEDPGISWPDSHRLPYSFNLWHNAQVGMFAICYGRLLTVENHYVNEIEQQSNI